MEMKWRRFEVVVAMAVFVWAMGLGQGQAQEYTVENYSFTWPVAQTGSVVMEIQKDTGEAIVVLANRAKLRLTTLYLAPNVARQIGEVLVNTEEYYGRLSGSQEKKPAEAVEVGSYKVNFAYNSPKQGQFEVVVQSGSRSGPGVKMYQDEAKEIGKALLESEKMAAFVNKRINL
jgi:hypothetical protein